MCAIPGSGCELEFLSLIAGRGADGVAGRRRVGPGGGRAAAAGAARLPAVAGHRRPGVRRAPRRGHLPRVAALPRRPDWCVGSTTAILPMPLSSRLTRFLVFKKLAFAPDTSDALTLTI